MKLFGVTDIGCHRKDNQDSYAVRQLTEEAALLVVCDGMGGAQAGSVASSLKAVIRSLPPIARMLALAAMFITIQRWKSGKWRSSHAIWICD